MSTLNYAGWELDYTWVASRQGLFLRTHTEYWNLAWLMYPDLDVLAGKPYNQWTDLSFVDNIMAHMDLDTIEALKLTPDQFMDYWDDLDDGTLMLTEGADQGYRDHMQRRASAAMFRLFPVQYPNVVRLNLAERRVPA